MAISHAFRGTRHSRRVHPRRGGGGVSLCLFRRGPGGRVKKKGKGACFRCAEGRFRRRAPRRRGGRRARGQGKGDAGVQARAGCAPHLRTPLRGVACWPAPLPSHPRPPLRGLPRDRPPPPPPFGRAGGESAAAAGCAAPIGNCTESYFARVPQPTQTLPNATRFAPRRSICKAKGLAHQPGARSPTHTPPLRPRLAVCRARCARGQSARVPPALGAWRTPAGAALSPRCGTRTRTGRAGGPAGPPGRAARGGRRRRSRGSSAGGPGAAKRARRLRESRDATAAGAEGKGPGADTWAHGRFGARRLVACTSPRERARPWARARLPEALAPSALLRCASAHSPRRGHERACMLRPARAAAWLCARCGEPCYPRRVARVKCYRPGRRWRCGWCADTLSFRRVTAPARCATSRPAVLRCPRSPGTRPRLLIS